MNSNAAAAPSPTLRPPTPAMPPPPACQTVSPMPQSSPAPYTPDRYPLAVGETDDAVACFMRAPTFVTGQIPQVDGGMGLK